MKALLLLTVVGSFWPAWLWFMQRSAGDGDLLAVLALLTAMFMLRLNSREQTQPNPGYRKSLKFPIILLIASGIGELFLPRSLQIALALCTVFSFVRALYGRLAPQCLGMLFLAAPAVSTLEFYLGYPLRSLAAALSSNLLNLSGLDAWAKGVQLFCRGHEIVIDSACSGLHMLWISFYLSLVLSWRRSLNLPATAVVLLSALLTTVGANAIRATAITIYEESTLYSRHWQDLSHQIIGLGCFLMVSAGIYWLVCRLDRHSHKQEIETISPREYRAAKPAIITALTAIFIAMLPLAPIRGIATASARATKNPPDYRTTLRQFGFSKYSARPLDPEEEKFAAAYPGSIAKFTCGDSSILLRSINSESRQVHSSADCYRGQGYDIKSRPIVIDHDKRWSRFSATKKSKELMVRECIMASDGSCWTDPSTWYWEALLGKTQGPWVFITVASPTQLVIQNAPATPLIQQARAQ